MALLELKGLTKYFGGLAAVNDLDMEVKEGAIHGLIGPNGAGKTTVFNVVTGFYKPTSGEMSFRGQNITGRRPDQVAKLGLVRTFQQTSLFMTFPVLANVMVGCQMRSNANFMEALLGLRSYRRKEKAILEKSMGILKFLGLDGLKDELAMNLPHGYQRALGVAIAMAAEPKLLMLDEPVTGMNPEETRHMMGLIDRVRQSGVTILLVEHDMKAVMGLCDQISVLNFGRKIAEGSPEEIQRTPEVIEAYLGAEEHAA